MTLDERIIDFLDGSLKGDDEAELLHSLSVSPEKRGVLRGFLDQRSLLAQDAKSLPVPYEAEQRLWQRMETVLPIPAEPSPIALMPVGSPSSVVNMAGFVAKAFSGISSAVGACALVAGLGIGYFAGHSQPAQVSSSIVSPSSNEAHQTYKTNGSYMADSPLANLKELPALPLPRLTPLVENAGIVPTLAVNAEQPLITQIAFTNPHPIALAAIGGDGSQPVMNPIRDGYSTDPSLLSRFEFRIDESFGREFPNSTATDVSMPIITNSSISTLFQVLPHSNLLWIGASYGSANVAMKTLYAKNGDPTDPLQQELAGDTNHAQTSYYAALAELRFPAFATTDITFTGGYGLASLGQMMFGEIGLHYAVSSQAGIQCGLRVLRFSYDLSAEEKSIINSGTSSFAVSNAVAASSASYNVEFNAGLFFHF